MSEDKVDLVMWTKNGAETLPYVLRQIDCVIPKKAVTRKIIIDDASADNTKLIASKFGWSVYLNHGKGISDGANTAFGYVESERFISFEQDVLLSPRWWPNVPRLLNEQDTAIASGSRFPSQPLALRNMLEYNLENYPKNLEDSDAFHFSKTLDNTIYRTKIIEKIGGFPKISLDACVDNVLAKRVYDAGFKWKVDYSVKSLHIRKGLRDELRHFYWYGAQSPILEPYITGKQANAKGFLKRLLLSPKYGIDLALKLNSPQLIYIYPLIRLALYRGLVSTRRSSKFAHASSSSFHNA
ncbi:MAG: glycosyltransferase family A protein [Candidatus Bathyarchaeia archaeon]|jgi:glycosyltransferase involved in cell wall biosynthesis